jgi:uncharacterized protein (TIGR02246 family)
MSWFARVLLLVLAMLAPATAFAADNDQVAAALERWEKTFNANDVAGLIKLYAPDAVLVGPTGSTLNEGTDAIRKYFSRLEKSGDKVTVGIRKVVVLDDKVAFVTGFYEFTAVRGGETRKSPAGFSMVLVKHGDEWLIAHQHSSRRSTPTQGG